MSTRFMKEILSSLTLILFLLAYSTQDIFTATTVLVSSSSMSLLFLYAVSPSALGPQDYVPFLAAIVLGSITLWLQNAFFIKMKPTLMLWGLAAALTYSATPWSEQFFPHEKISTKMYKKIDRHCINLYMIMGTLNIVVALACSTEHWVFFKVVGLTVLQFLFFLYIAYIVQKEKKVYDISLSKIGE